MPTTILDGETYEQALHRRFTEEAKVIEKMQQDEIIRMAREAGLNIPDRRNDLWMPQLERFASLVAENTGIEQQREIVRLKAIIEEQANGAQNLVLAEREACAKVCDEHAAKAEANGYTVKGETFIDGFGDGSGACAAAIRVRGEK